MVKYEETVDGVKRTGQNVEAVGKTTSLEYTAKYDGKDYPVTGSELFDTIAIKRIDDHNAQATLKRSGKVIGKAHRSVSSDGKVMTVKISATSAKGEKVNNVVVYDKE